MRSNCDWFSKRAKTTWNAEPGLSMLLLVPQGCDETEASKLVRGWTEKNFVPPLAFNDHKPVCISLTTDSMLSCEHFAQTFAKRLTRGYNIQLETEADDYPTDIIQGAVEAMLAAGYYPIVAIERFHAFALINDSGMTSVLSGMRTLENSGQLTTLAFSPLSYAMIRRLMQPGLPFLNSVYGDNHDQVVMTPLTRQEFVSYAGCRGLSPQRSNFLFSKGGGPDAVYKALVDVSHLSDGLVIDACLARIDETLDKFLSRSFIVNGESDEQLLSKLAIGKLLRQEMSFILSNPLHPFLVKETPSGELVCNSQIIARKILRANQPKWRVYGLCIEAMSKERFETAAEIASTFDDPDPRLIAFKEAVLLRSAILPRPGVGLLGIDWANVVGITKRINSYEHLLPETVANWAKDSYNLAKSVVTNATGALNRLQLDALTSSSSDAQIRLATLRILGLYIESVFNLDSPTQRILHLVNVPEAILQAISSGFCGMNFIKFENIYPDAPYNDYFGGVESFKIPNVGSKVALTSLIVMIPAILSLSPRSGCDAFINQTLVKSQQQKLVDCVRNPASHTVVAFLEKDATFLYDVCKLWIESWSMMEGYDSFSAFKETNYLPTSDEISSTILG
ncbi:hypothetical protein LOY57_20505 [Pseudomonas moraviensis]|uniref:hypothetical protein n=1 Tax=Pseudomonas moraviensis TaxID=321662 RepID=UPI00215FDC62|nr:hypothetical protein [Pseudomonas moraviensis]UVL45056.1 hypothetical protein LOY57_20505 [Pseudomonas moraviensis]